MASISKIPTMWLRRVLTSAIAGLALILSGSIYPAHGVSQSWKIAKKNFSSKTGGYLSKVSVLAGDPLQAFITCHAKSYTVELFRMGYYEGAGAISVWKSDSTPCTHQPRPTRDGLFDLIGTKWQSPISIDTTEREPGFYLAKICATDKTAAFMPLVIRSPSVEGAVVMVMPDLTSLAYNKWSGASAYTSSKGFEERARNFSFNIPLSQGLGSGIYLNYLHPLLMVASALPINLAYVSDVDVATIPNLLHGAASYVSPGHDEYWTQSERDSVIKARAEGTNLLFFGANVAYWRVRLTGGSATSNPVMAIYKSSISDPDKSAPTIRFRDTGAHEESLTGVQYRCFPAKGAFTIKDAGSFIFDNVDTNTGANYYGLIGPEVDAYKRSKFTPGQVSLIASSQITCGFKDEKPAHSEMTYSVLPGSKAGTIAVGTMNWVSRGLSREVPQRTAQLVIEATKNILQASSEGPLGIAHPIDPAKVAK